MINITAHRTFELFFRLKYGCVLYAKIYKERQVDKQRQLDKCRQVSTEVDALFPFDKERDR